MESLQTFVSWVLVAGAAYWLADRLLFSSQYAAEVGYYAGEDIRWDLWGDFKNLEDCKRDAQARYMFYANQNSRAYTWSCLRKNGKGGYASRHR